MLYREDKSCMAWGTANEIQELLAQPEQEPVAWISLSDIEWMNIVNDSKILELTDGRHDSEDAVNLAVKMTEEKCKKNNSDSIPKRKSIEDKELEVWYSQHAWSMDKQEYIWGFRDAEKAHGITGGEE